MQPSVHTTSPAPCRASSIWTGQRGQCWACRVGRVWAGWSACGRVLLAAGEGGGGTVCARHLAVLRGCAKDRERANLPAKCGRQWEQSSPTGPGVADFSNGINNIEQDRGAEAAAGTEREQRGEGAGTDREQVGTGRTGHLLSSLSAWLVGCWPAGRHQTGGRVGRGGVPLAVRVLPGGSSAGSSAPAHPLFKDHFQGGLCDVSGRDRSCL